MPKKKKCGTCAHCLQPKLKMKCQAMPERPPLQGSLAFGTAAGLNLYLVAQMRCQLNHLLLSGVETAQNA